MKYDLWLLSGSTRNQHSDTSLVSTTPSTTSTGTPKNGFDWEGKLDDSGKVTLAIFKQTVTGKIDCPKCNHNIPIGADHEMALKWMQTFAKLYQAKVGAMRVQVAIDARQQSVTLSTADRERVEAELRPAIEKEIGREIWAHINGTVCEGCKEKILREEE